MKREISEEIIREYGYNRVGVSRDFCLVTEDNAHVYLRKIGSKCFELISPIDGNHNILGGTGIFIRDEDTLCNVLKLQLGNGGISFANRSAEDIVDILLSVEPAKIKYAQICSYYNALLNDIIKFDVKIDIIRMLRKHMQYKENYIVGRDVRIGVLYNKKNYLNALLELTHNSINKIPSEIYKNQCYKEYRYQEYYFDEFQPSILNNF